MSLSPYFVKGIITNPKGKQQTVAAKKAGGTGIRSVLLPLLVLTYMQYRSLAELQSTTKGAFKQLPSARIQRIRRAARSSVARRIGRRGMMCLRRTGATT